MTNCPWCAEFLRIDPRATNFCPYCLHRSDVQRELCDCTRCQTLDFHAVDALPPVPEVVDLPPVPDHVAGGVVAETKITERYATPGSFSALLKRCVPHVLAEIVGTSRGDYHAKWFMHDKGADLCIIDTKRKECVIQVQLTGQDLVKVFDAMRAYADLKEWIKAQGIEAPVPKPSTVSPVT